MIWPPKIFYCVSGGSQVSIKNQPEYWTARLFLNTLIEFNEYNGYITISFLRLLRFCELVNKSLFCMCSTCNWIEATDELVATNSIKFIRDYRQGDFTVQLMHLSAYSCYGLVAKTQDDGFGANDFLAMVPLNILLCWGHCKPLDQWYASESHRCSTRTQTFPIQTSRTQTIHIHRHHSIYSHLPSNFHGMATMSRVHSQYRPRTTK